MTIYDYEDEGPIIQFSSSVIRKSRKHRVCEWCNIEIKPRQRYRRHTWKIDDEMGYTIGCLDSPNCMYY